jgi:hypothetical protein
MYNRTSSILSSLINGAMIGVGFGSLFFSGFILGKKTKEQEYMSAKTKRNQK